MAASSADRHMHEYGRPPRPDAGLPKSGDVLHLGRKASVQFNHPILFRVIRVHDWTTYDGWVWLDGYQLNIAGDAVERRTVFVQIAGLRWIPRHPTRAPATSSDQRYRGNVRPSRASRPTPKQYQSPSTPLRPSKGKSHPVSRVATPT
jgi:hypothetical protein